MTTQRADAYLLLDYPNAPGTRVATRAELAGRPVQCLSPTVSTTTAAAWGTAATIAPGSLTPGNYAIVGYSIYSATGKLVKFAHGNFAGLMPGGPIGNAICQRKSVFMFSDLDACPVFDSRETLQIDLLTVSAETPVINWIMLVKLD